MKPLVGCRRTPNMTPDVAENLMPKSDNDSMEIHLTNLIKALQNTKEIVSKKSELNGEDKLK